MRGRKAKYVSMSGYLPEVNIHLVLLPSCWRPVVYDFGV